jgi:preprotein translocase subunit Sss1
MVIAFPVSLIVFVTILVIGLLGYLIDGTGGD